LWRGIIEQKGDGFVNFDRINDVVIVKDEIERASDGGEVIDKSGRELFGAAMVGGLVAVE
jgi:hypothetical protein